MDIRVRIVIMMKDRMLVGMNENTVFIEKESTENK
jgi:hypothetical protein